MENEIRKLLCSMGYENCDGGKGILFYKRTGEETYVVAVESYNPQLTWEICEKNNEQVIKKLYELGAKQIRILHLIITKDGLFPQDVMEITEKINGVWLIAKDTGRVYIFENQTNQFDGLNDKLEEALGEKSFVTKPFVPYVSIGFVLCNVVIFLYFCFAGKEDTFLKFVLDWSQVLEDKEYYRLFTCMFLHFDTEHLINNMVTLIATGTMLEKMIGHGKYTIIYIGTGLLASVGSLIYHACFKEYAVCAGASGAIFGVLGSLFITILWKNWKDKKVLIKRMLMFIAFSVFQGIMSVGIDNTAHAVGFISGCICGGILSFYSKKINNY